jgi:hypothetical protein
MAQRRTDIQPSVAGRIDQRFPRLVWVLLILLAIQGPFPGLVLCIGGDRHLAVETAHNNFHLPPCLDYEGPCLDIPLANVSVDGQVVASAPGPLSPQGALSLAVPTISLPSLVEDLASGNPLQSLLAVHVLIASLRTVILRI